MNVSTRVMVLFLALTFTALLSCGPRALVSEPKGSTLARGPQLGTSDEFLDWMIENRPRVGLVAYRIKSPESAISLNGDDAFPLASVRKILILVAYGEAVLNRGLDPDEQVLLEDVDRWHWPATDGGAHAAALKDLASRDLIKGSDRRSTVRLDSLVWAMVRFSDNAASDYLLQRIGGVVRVDDLAASRGLASQDPFLSVLGEYLAWTKEPVDTWISISATDRQARAVEYTESISRSEFLKSSLPPKSDQRLLASVSVRGSPRDWSQLMASIQSGEGFPLQSISLIRKHLEWPSTIGSINRRPVNSLGTKGGSLVGVLTETSYIEPRDKDALVAALFIRDLPDHDWYSLSDSYAHQEFLHDLALRDGFFEEARARLHS